LPRHEHFSSASTFPSTRRSHLTTADPGELFTHFGLPSRQSKKGGPDVRTLLVVISTLFLAISIYPQNVSARDKKNDQRQPGVSHKVQWNGRNDRGQQVSSGVYFYKLAAQDFVRTRKMVLLK
jgi:hypothetical protein